MDMSGRLGGRCCQGLDDGVGHRLGGPGVLTGDDVPVDDDVARPGSGTVVEHCAGVLQGRVDVPGKTELPGFGQWLFDGYRMTCFTDEEEDQTEPGKLGLPWYVDTALKNAGAVFDDGPAAWASHVVVDRHIITGQNPGSTEAVADAVIKALTAAATEAA